MCFVRKGVRNEIQEIIWFGKYRMIECIGRGGFATVYLAEHLTLKTFRAIKQISKSGIDRSLVLSEAELLKNLKHPGIPIIFDIEEDENNIYVIEEYIEGESLEAFVLHQNKISENNIIQIGVQLCEILNYLHQLKPYPLLYLDMKPEHIFLCADQIRLVDFGISAYLDEKSKIYASYGTKGYAAPEQYKKEALGVSTDLYGVGCVLSFLAKEGGTVVSRKLSAIIKRAMKEELAFRYASALEMEEELLAIQRKKLRFRKKRTKQHLLKKIAVCGSMERIGVTHFSIAFVSFLNEVGYYSFYQENNEKNDLWKIAVNRKNVVEKSGFLFYEYFCARRNEQEKVNPLEFDYQVMDCGSLGDMAKNIREADSVILLVGARDWEKDEAVKMLEKYRDERDIVIVSNYGDEKTAREYAKLAEKRVYCFPLDENPFCVNDKKSAFFRQMLEKERW